MSYGSSGSTRVFDNLTPGQRARYTVGGLAALVALIAAICVGCASIGAFDTIDAGHIAVLRNGGFANTNIRGFLPPGSGMTWTGLYSTEHVYPAQQQVYTISADPSQGSTPTADTIDVPSSDGVDITIQGTLYYSLNLNPAVLGQFDDEYGTQTYASQKQLLHPYDGSAGWDAFVQVVVRPTLQNLLRTAMSQFSCEDVDSSCALVKNSTNAAAAVSTSGATNNGNLGKIQDQINGELAADLDSQLGSVPVTVNGKAVQEGFLQNMRFAISEVSLPTGVQNAIDSAQAAFAQVSTAQAQLNSAQLKAKADQVAQQGYNACPACAEIAELAALPKNLTTYAPGTGFAVGAH